MIFNPYKAFVSDEMNGRKIPEKKLKNTCKLQCAVRNATLVVASFLAARHNAKDVSFVTMAIMFEYAKNDRKLHSY